MFRTRPASLHLAIDRLRKTEVATDRDFRSRVTNPPSNGALFTGVVLVILIVASLPFWREFPDWTVGQFTGKPQPSNGPLLASAYIVGFAVALGLNTIKVLYNVRIKWADHILRYVWLSKHNPGHIAFSAIASYALSVWAFALAYYYMQHGQLDPLPFKPFDNESFFSWVYFSTVTMATVGFGEVTPVTDWGRAVVSAEIILGVAYQVFFFSIVASFVRERSSS